MTKHEVNMRLTMPIVPIGFFIPWSSFRNEHSVTYCFRVCARGMDVSVTFVVNGSNVKVKLHHLLELQN